MGLHELADDLHRDHHFGRTPKQPALKRPERSGVKQDDPSSNDDIARKAEDGSRGGEAVRHDQPFECGHRQRCPDCSKTATKTPQALLAKDPPGRTSDQDQAAADCRDEFHALLSLMELASWIALGPDSQLNAATGCEALHCATISRAQPSHWPHWVATPSSNWTSSKVMPART
eukprot:NODE_3604_length_765_cov_24.397183.p1 GENE.NODE_3604_length_765_cov_24.397183~~NODE_3604_length_765_cov_24.397183.p1  ORF type:complete len:174 (-),score=6.41 NODE_3604_length_765_cov_24.397183:227-748(-)